MNGLNIPDEVFQKVMDKQMKREAAMREYWKKELATPPEKPTRSEKMNEVKSKNKTSNLVIRISGADKEGLKALAERREMAMSELVIYLIRREIDLDRLGLQVSDK